MKPPKIAAPTAGADPPKERKDPAKVAAPTAGADTPEKRRADDAVSKEGANEPNDYAQLLDEIGDWINSAEYSEWANSQLPFRIRCNIPSSTSGQPPSGSSTFEELEAMLR